jgi:Ni/Fe-hydrogenase subunit HybB-like protein
MEAGSGTSYNPRWSEIAITLSIVAVGFAVFRLVAHYFPVFEAASHQVKSEKTETKEADPVSVG